MTEKNKIPDCDVGDSLVHHGLEQHKGLGCTKQSSFEDLQKNIFSTILEERKQIEGIECSLHPCGRGGSCRTKLVSVDDEGRSGDDLDLDTINVKYVTVEVDDCPNRLGWECTVIGKLSIESKCYCQ